MHARNRVESNRSAQLLRESLLQYQRAPGQYNLSQRQPQLLFDSLREVLQLAIARDGEVGRAVQAAACYFVRAGLLHATADHYTLLGLTPDATADVIKDRYRLMMRLLHPDFAQADGPHWPSDTAARVNRAYEVLSDPIKRQPYDEARRAPPMQPERPEYAAMAKAPVRAPQPRCSWRHTTRAGLKTLSVRLAFGGGCLTLLALSTDVQPPQYLVQLPARGGSSGAAPSAREQAELAVALKTSARAAYPMPESAASPPQSPTAASHSVALLASGASLSGVSRPAQSASAHRNGARMPVLARPESARAIAAPLLNSTNGLTSATLAQAPVRAQSMAEPSPQSPVPPPAAPVPILGATPSLAEVQGLVAIVLHYVQGAQGDALLDLVERDGRRNMAIQRFAQQIDAIGAGARIISAELKPETHDQALMVSGELRVDSGSSAAQRKLVVRMTFTARDGAAVLSDLSGRWVP